MRTRNRSLFIWIAPAGLLAQSLTTAHTEYIRAGDRVVATVSTPAVVFTDSAFGTSSYLPFLNAADVMYADRLTSGCSGGSYCPDLALPRNSAAVFVVRAWSLRMWGDPEAFWQQNKSPVNTVAYFSDVPTTDSLYKYVQKLYELGITSGCSSSPPTFCATTNASNSDLAVFTIRGRGAVEQGCLGPSDYSGRSCGANLPSSYTYTDSPSFADVPVDHTPGSTFQWAQLSIRFGAVSPSIPVTGCLVNGSNLAGYFCPGSAATRGQAAASIVRIELGDRSF